MNRVIDHTMCRLCLCQGCRLVDIFEDDGVGVEFVVKKVIEELLQLEVEKEALYPWMICHSCLDKLSEFYLFKRRCIESQHVYDNRVRKRKSSKGKSRRSGHKLQEAMEIDGSNQEDDSENVSPLDVNVSPAVEPANSCFKIENEFGVTAEPELSTITVPARNEANVPGSILYRALQRTDQGQLKVPVVSKRNPIQAVPQVVEATGMADEANLKAEETEVGEYPTTISALGFIQPDEGGAGNEEEQFQSEANLKAEETDDREYPTTISALGFIQPDEGGAGNEEQQCQSESCVTTGPALTTMAAPAQRPTAANVPGSILYHALIRPDRGLPSGLMLIESAPVVNQALEPVGVANEITLKAEESEIGEYSVEPTTISSLGFIQRDERSVGNEEQQFNSEYPASEGDSIDISPMKMSEPEDEVAAEGSWWNNPLQRPTQHDQEEANIENRGRDSSRQISCSVEENLETSRIHRGQPSNSPSPEAYPYPWKTPLYSTINKGIRCVYRGCASARHLDPRLRFYHFPCADEERRKKWIDNSGNPGFHDLPVKKVVGRLLCEKHFFREYVHPSGRLGQGAVPFPYDQPPGTVEQKKEGVEDFAVLPPLRTYGKASKATVPRGMPHGLRPTSK